MFNTKPVLSLLAILAMGVPSLSLAQNSRYDTDPDASSYSTQTDKRTLADKLDDFGQTIFGGILPKEEKPKETVRTPRTTTKPAASTAVGTSSPNATIASRAGSAMTPKPKPTLQSILGLTPQETSTADRRSIASPPSTSVLPSRSASTKSPYTSADSPSYSSARTTPIASGDRTSIPSALSQPKADPEVRRPVQRMLPEESTTSETKSVVSVAPPQATAKTSPPATAEPASRTSASADKSDPLARPLYERLSIFTQSAFDNPTPQTKSTGLDSKADSKAESLPSSPEKASPVRTVPAGADAVPKESRGLSQPAAMSQPSPATRPAVAGTITGRSNTTSLTKEPAASRTPGAESDDSAASTASSAMSAGKEPSVLFARKSPMLSVETVGPRRIAVGKESIYRVTIQNAGEAADDVVVLIDLPAWADVLAAEASTGATHAATPGDPARAFQWKIGRMEAAGHETLALRIVPRESRPFDLAVRWEYQPAASQTMIEVQEPKLMVNLDGPAEVLYGQKEIFKLRLSNSGSGDAENVLITLMPLGGSGNQPVSHNLGVLGAGKDTAIEVELTARQVGDLLINVQVQADGGVHAELSEKVLVRRPALQVDVEGPPFQYVGAEASYQVRVRNPGTAPAQNVKIAVNMPPGAKYLSGVDGSEVAANGTEVRWTLDSLNAGGQQVFTLKCLLGLAGASRIEAVAKGAGDLAATGSLLTKVEAMADLVLDLKDPTGPVPVGNDATYELKIRNRGTSSAHEVEVVAYFSRGIEPIKAEGVQGRIAPGQVVFTPIPSVAAGGEYVLVVHARAETPGNHICRVEVQCKSLGTRLVSEETTHYYQVGATAQEAIAEGSQPQPATSPAAPSSVAPSEVDPSSVDPLRTAQRPEPMTPQQGPPQPTRAVRPSGAR